MQKTLQRQVPFAKLDPATQMISATLLVPEVVDLAGTLISADEIRKAATGYMLAYQIVGEGHVKDARAQVVESHVGIGLNYAGDYMWGWHVTLKIADDALWAKIVEGTYKGMSIGGVAEFVPEPDTPWQRMLNVEVYEASVVPVPAVPDAVLYVYRSAKAPVLEAKQDDEDGTTLVEQIQAGEVKPRVRMVKDVCQGILCALHRAWEGVAALTGSQDNQLAETGETTQEVSTDMDAEVLKALTDRLEAVEKQLAALGENDESKAVPLQPDAANDGAFKQLQASIEALDRKLNLALKSPAPSQAIPGTEGQQNGEAQWQFTEVRDEP